MNPRRAALCLCAALGLLSGSARADDDDKTGVFLDLPLLELPFNGVNGGYTAPSMRQSLWLASDAYQMLHHGIGRLVDPYDPTSTGARLLGRALVTVSDLLVTQLPLGGAWEHETWHRAVLSHAKVKSHDAIYNFRFTELIGVDHISDEDLSRMKARSPADMVRLGTAGMEGNYELVTNLEKAQFFYQTRSWNLAAYWELTLINIGYMNVCVLPYGDKVTDQQNSDDGANVGARDFTGLDCTGWARDLFQPDAPYARRNTPSVHPSGVGINRYIHPSDLSSAELGYLRLQTYLSLLNLVDPMLFGKDEFVAGGPGRGRPTRWNGHLRYEPSSFGSALSAEIFMQRSDVNLFFALRNYYNHEHWFPGVDAEILRFPLDLVIGLPVSVSGRVAAWLQPRDQRFETASLTPGGLAQLRLGYSFARTFEPYVELEAKSAGWVAGNVALDSDLTFRLGLVSMLFN